LSLNSLTQALQSAGIGAFGISMPVLAQDWTPAGGSPSYSADDSTMALTISGGNWAAPCAAVFRVVDPASGHPAPVTLTNADGTTQTGPGVLLTLFEAAWLRLGRLYASMLETPSAARPEQAIGLPARQVPRYFFYPGQTSGDTDGMAQAQADLGFGGDLRVYDNDGLPVDPVAVMAAFTALMTANQILQSGTPSATPPLGTYLGSLAPQSEIRVRVTTPDGEPYSGSLLTGLTAVTGVAGSGLSTVSQGTPVQVQAVSQGFSQDDRNRVVLGPATSGRLTDSFTPPALPAGVTLQRDFFTLTLVQLKAYLLGTMAATDPATQSQQPADVRINENPALLTNGNDVLGAIQSSAGAPASPSLAVAQALDGQFSLPASAGQAAQWPNFPTGITVGPPTDVPPLTLPSALTVTAAYVNTAAADFTKADVVVTIAGWPAVTANAWVRLYTRLFGVNAVQQRGDGQGRLVPASGTLSIYLTDPLGLRQPGMNPGQILVPPSATLNFDMAVVLPNQNARVYGGLSASVGPGPTPPPAFDPGTNPTTAAGCLQGVCGAGVLGLGQPSTVAPPTTLLGWVEALTGEGNPRDASRFPTMARREVLCAGFASGSWSGLIAGGRVARETLCNLPRLGCPGGFGGRETTVTGVSASGGRVGYDIARHALRRAQNIVERVVTLAGSAWNLPAEPSPVAAGQQPAGASGTFAAAALQNIAPYCETPEIHDLLAQNPSLIDNAIDQIIANTTILPDSLPNRQDIVNALNSLKSSPPAGTPTPSSSGLIIAAELIRELSSSAFGRRDSQWALANAISTARHFIYIETPGFCSTADTSATLPAYAIDLIGALSARLTANPGLRLMICCPKNPDFAPGYEGMAAYEVQDRYKIVVGNPAAGQPSALPTTQTVGFHPIGFPGRYSRIETSVVVVDDRWLLIGGSTFRRRGLTFDGSSDLVLADTRLENGRSPAIRDFRRTLLAARLGIPADQEHPSYVQLNDGQRAFQLIRQTLQAGGLGKIDLWWNGQTPGVTATTALPVGQANPDGRDFDAATAALIAVLAASTSGW
jgi:phosphatidylserine/phosphatidylglycerophosphate/cardiolipin synthase-like enzyme